MIIIISVITGAILVFFLLVSRAAIDLKEVARMIDHGEYNKAKNILQKRLHSGKFSADAHYLMARLYFHNDQDDYALMELKIIIKYNKFGAIALKEDIYRMMGDLYLNLGKLDEAYQQYLALEKSHPGEYSIIIHLGNILFHKGNYEDAIGYFNKAAKLRPNDSGSIGGVGMSYFQMGDMEKAKANLEQAVLMDNKNFTAHYYYALYYHKHQLFDFAVAEYEKAMVDKKLKIKSLFGMGECNREKGVNVRAIECFERLVYFIEEKGDKIGDSNKRKAYYADEFNLEARYKLARAYFDDKNFSSALEQWQEISIVSPEYKDVRSLVQENARYGKDRLQDLLIMKEMDYEKITRYMVDFLGYIIKKLNVVNKEQIMIEAQADTLDVFQGVTLIMAKRSFNPVGEREVSSLYDEMQKHGFKKGLIISASGASPTGLKFALDKPIDFAGKNMVMRLLKRYEHRI